MSRDRRLAASRVLRLNPVACGGHGSCAELLPEMISLDEWGYPVLAAGPVPAALARRAGRAVAACPALALALDGPAAPGSPAAQGSPAAPGTSADSEQTQRPHSAGSPDGPARLGT